MAIVINGSGTITGISTGGLPDGIVDDGTLATSAVTSTKIADGTITNADINASAAIVASKLSGAGKVLQVVSTTSTSTMTTSSTSYTGTGLITTLTPSSTSSKILVILSGGMTNSGGFHNAQTALYSSIGGAGYGSVVAPIEYRQYSAYAYYGFQHAFNYLYSPNTTSSVGVQPYFKTSTLTNYFNGSATAITLTLMEIGA
jgi:hypothetical protein